MRYLFDTNVLVAAFRSRNGASNALVRRALQGDLSPAVHHKLAFEYRDVLCRPDILAQTGLAWADIELVLAHLVANALEVEVRYLWRPNLKDEGDNFILEIAVAAWPCTIVTHNLKDFVNAELRFPQIALCTPGQLLQSLTH
jgi:uncharacterized protein